MRFHLSRRTLGYGFFLIAAAAVATFSAYTEIRPIAHVIVASAFLMVFLICRTLFLGIVTSSLFAAGTIFLIYGASKFKFWLTARRLHPYDLYLYFNLDNLRYARILFPGQYLLLYAGIAAVIISFAVLVWVEGLHRPSKMVFAGFLAVVATLVTVQQVGKYGEYGVLGGGNRFMHFDHQHVSTFLISAAQSLPELLAGKAFDYGSDIALSPERIEEAKKPACTAGAETPDLYVVMRESAMIPASLPEMEAPQVGPERFRSSNGKTYRLRVETHGAGSAHTIFSVLTGLSAESFGEMKNIGIDLSTGRIKMAVPQMLKDCGYRTLAITTGIDGYVMEEAFYKSIGFDEYYDYNDTIAFSNGDDSDRAVYAFARSITAKMDGSRPLLVYIDTTATHGPYSYKKWPEREVPDAAAVSPEASEYLRRLLAGEQDFQDYIADLGARVTAGGHRALITDFGDHHPSFTKYLPGRSGLVDESRQADDDLLITYFRMTSLGFSLPALPDHSLVDAAFVGDWLLRASGLPVQGIYGLRWAMVEKCASRYWRCENEAPAHELHQTLRAAGLITIP